MLKSVTKIFPETSFKQIGPPWGYVFNKWDGPPLDIINYIPPNAGPNTPLLIVIPGASRDAQRFHGSWLDLAKKHHFSVVTIGASKKFFPNEYSNHVSDKHPQSVNINLYTLDVLIEMFLI